MFNYISMKNFKAFRTASLELRPITVLAGANSSGKSSIIHVLLLLKQTLESHRNRPLILSGEFLNFSRYDEIVFGRRKDEPVTFSLALTGQSLPTSLTRGRLSAFFGPAEVETILTAGQPERLRSMYEVTYKVTFAPFQERERRGITIRSACASSLLAGLELRRAELRLEQAAEETYTGTVSIPSPGGLTPLHDIVDVEWTNFLPARADYRTRDMKGKAGRNEVPLDLFAIPNLRVELTERLHYVGPLRSEPQRAYFVLGDRVELGYRGEYTAQVLLLERDEPVDYVIDGQFREKAIGLLEAVNRTLKMMNLQSIEPFSREGVVSQLMLPLIRDDKPIVTIVDVGFGISQLLPIIVAGLRANRGDTLILEQPETHLHPKVQEALADFLVLLYHLGKHVIVETHSDHLINGLRVRIVDDQTDTLKDAVQVAFVRIPEAKGEGSLIEPLQFDEYGMIVNWPPEFMSDGMKQMQEILRLGVEKQRRKRSR
jgi:predicted ATPase